MKGWLKTLLQLVVIVCGLTFLVILFFYCGIGMNYYPVLFPLLPLFYLLEGLFFCFLVYDADRKGEGVSVKKTILLRVVRILGSIILLGVGTLADRVHFLSFIILFVVYYLACMIFESKIMMDVNKRNRR